MSIPSFAPSLQADEPCDPFMAGLTFFHPPVPDRDVATVHEYIKAMQRAGAVVSPVHGAGVTHAILSKTGPPGCADHDVSCAATRVGSRVVTWFWIEQCLKSNALVSVDDSALFKPPPSLDGLPEFRDVKVCVTGYTGDRRNELITIVGLLGGEYMRSLDRRSTHLVCYDFQGAKWAKANETKIQKVVSHRWLEECLTKYAKLGELPFSTRSGKDEDAAALAALEDPEIPDSDDETTETETNVIEDSLVTEPAEPVGNATGKRRDASLCVTELTDGAREAANAKSSKTPPATVLRDISSTQTQPLDDPPGTGGMEPPAPHGPTQDAVTEKQSPVHGSDLLSPDWSALELRQSQHVERSKRNETLDPRLAEVLRRGEKPSREQQCFAGRIGSPNAVELAFGGRFADRAPQRFHRFNDHDAPLAHDDFDVFLAHVACGTWDPDFGTETVSEALPRGTPRWARRVLSEETHFEVLPNMPPAVPPGIVLHETTTKGTFLATCASPRVTKEQVDVWIEAHRDARVKSARGPLGVAVLARLKLESAKEVGQHGHFAGPDALLVTFLEIYCPFGHEMGWESLRALLRDDRDGKLRLRDVTDVVTLPARAPGNLEGVILKEVKRHLREVLVGFHELLAGPTEPDLTQQMTQGVGLNVVAPPSTKAWSAEQHARMSIQACAPGSQAAVAAASAGWLGDEEDEDEEDAPSPDTNQKKPRVEADADVRGALVGKFSAVEAEFIHESKSSEDENETHTVVQPARKNGWGAKKNVLLTQDTSGDESPSRVPSAAKNKTRDEKVPSAKKKKSPARAATTEKTPVAARPTRTPRSVTRSTATETPAAKATAPASSKRTRSVTKEKETPAVAQTPAVAETPAVAQTKPPVKNSAPKSKPAPPSAKKVTKPKTQTEFLESKSAKPRVALSGFGSADLTKYGAAVSRLGGVVCAGHGWDTRATHVVFGPRGSRSLKFLAGAAAGTPLLDASWVDASKSRGRGKLLGKETYKNHLWQGGWRGTDAGLVTRDASAFWQGWVGEQEKYENDTHNIQVFKDLSVGVAPFPSANKAERDALVVVLRAGGAVVSLIGAKGLVSPGTPVLDVVIVDTGSSVTGGGSIDLSGTAGATAGGGGARVFKQIPNRVACVSPEFFKSWLSRPGADLSPHVLRGAVTGALAEALKRTGSGGADDVIADETDEDTDAEEEQEQAPRPAKRAKSVAKSVQKTTPKSGKKSILKPKPAKTPARATAKDATASAATGSGSKRRGSPAQDRPVQIMGKRRRVLGASN